MIINRYSDPNQEDISSYYTVINNKISFHCYDPSWDGDGVVGWIEEERESLPAGAVLEEVIDTDQISIENENEDEDDYFDLKNYNPYRDDNAYFVIAINNPNTHEMIDSIYNENGYIAVSEYKGCWPTSVKIDDIDIFDFLMRVEEYETMPCQKIELSLYDNASGHHICKDYANVEVYIVGK